MRKPTKKPKLVWIVYDPKGVARSVYLNHPGADAICWPYVNDSPKHSSNSVETPKDFIAARKAGYRLKFERIEK